MTAKDLARLSGWLRCYPVVGRENERKELMAIVEQELAVTNKRERSERIRAGLSLDGWGTSTRMDGPMINYSESEFFQRQIVMEASDDCRQDGSPLCCGAEWFADKNDEFGEVYCCVLPQGHTPKRHLSRKGHTW